MRFIEFARALLGILFVMRTLHVFRGRVIVRPATIHFVGLIALVTLTSIGFFAPDSALVRVSFTLAIVVATVAALMIVERRRLTAYRSRVPLFVDKWILNLRLGSSLNGARARALGEEDAEVRALLGPVFESGSFDRRRHVILSPAVLREFEQIARATHAGLERLELLRSHLRDESEFRRKSGQAVRQAGIQAAVMLFMLVALSIFTIHHYGWAQSGDFVTAAAALSVLGAVVMNRLTRKKKWNL